MFLFVNKGFIINTVRKMSSNVEIKAKVNDIASLLSKASSITNGTILEQEDTYFKISEGRLKMRQTKNCPTELIYYNRPDCEGPKRSNYHKQVFQNEEEANGLKTLLKAALGVRGIVKKKRNLFLIGQTRLHVDDVENLGHFMELEVMLSPDQSTEEGQIIAENLMTKLEIAADTLLPLSYIDYILGSNN